jgi:hypothetical protein
MATRKPRFPNDVAQANAGRFAIDDDECTTSSTATLWLDDALSKGVYTVRLETLDVPASREDCQGVTLRLRWRSDWDDCVPQEGDVSIPISGGSRGVRALIGLLERVASRAEARGHLVAVPPRQRLARAG